MLTPSNNTFSSRRDFTFSFTFHVVTKTRTVYNKINANQVIPFLKFGSLVVAIICSVPGSSIL